MKDLLVRCESFGVLATTGVHRCRGGVENKKNK